jgi:decaprenyl-phosphate phosphoribosyltransferase
MDMQEALAPSAPVRSKLRGHIEILRIDHAFKNVFVLPGIIAGISADYDRVPAGLATRIVLGLVAICLVASSNYVINEVLDAPTDLAHPVKRLRPVPAGQVNVPLAYVQWLALMIVGVSIGRLISPAFAVTMIVLWVMGCIYNIRPARSKDVPYIDVLSEAVNNPLRLLAGWYITDVPSLAPSSLLLSYWMVGCYFMALKRFAEYRAIANPARAAAYRKSFGYYTEERLLVSIMFYAAAGMLFLGAFVMRYRLELILAFPMIALVMAVYLLIACKPNSTVQAPEGLYKEPKLMLAVLSCAAVIGGTMLVDVPALHRVFAPTAPTNEVVPRRR